MEKRVLRIVPLLLLFACSYTQEVKAQTYSGSGRRPPSQLSERQLTVLSEVVDMIPSSENRTEILALIMVESNLTTTAVSRTGDYGIMQVNCRIWRDRLRTELGIQNCEQELMNPRTGIRAGVYVLNRFRRYRRCQGSNVYACYNGGQSWRGRAERCQAACQEDACRRRCWRPARYADSVRRHVRFLTRKYSDRIREVLQQKKE